MNTAFLFRGLQAPQRIRIDPQRRGRQFPRRSSSSRPIALAATLAAGTFAGAMLVPASGSAFSSAGSPVNTAETAHTTPKTSRLAKASAIAATQAIPGVVKAPGACMPSSTEPSHPRPIAYV